MSSPRIAGSDDFPGLARLIHRSSLSPQTHCIHASTGEPAGALVDEMAQLSAKNEMAWAIRTEGGTIVGALGAEYDPRSGRAWLRGPFGERDWAAATGGLWPVLRAAFPGEISRFDTFLNVQNTRAAAFYAHAGFREIRKVHVYQASAGDWRGSGEGRGESAVQPLRDVHHSGFAALHDRLFPRTFLTGAQIVENLDDRHQAWVAVDGEAVEGYVFAAGESWSEEGQIEFLGVAEAARGRGLGGALLRTALAWLFDARGLASAGLTVDDENTDARGLYERNGFRHLHTGVNHRLELAD